MINKYYGYYNSPIGILEIITSDTAIVSAMFVEEEGKKSLGESQIFKQAIKQFDEYFKGIRKDFDIEYEMQGTEFQKKVWDILIEIPYGVTISYKELAIAIGNEKASRAVGNANGKNIISIIVPCHRVIGSDKSLTGYAGGLNRKRWLLEHEGDTK